MKSKMRQTGEYNERSRLTDTEDKLVVTSGEVGQGNAGWQVQTAVCETEL